MSEATVRIYIEATAKRAVAASIDWPGWCRIAKTEEQAIETLAAYAPRYAPVAGEAGLDFPVEPRFEVVERLEGGTTTDFGAPEKAAGADREPQRPEDLARLAAIVGACWVVFDGVVAGAPAELRKGPRGGGRNRDKMAQHVLNAERSYARAIGVKPPVMQFTETAAVAAHRAALLDAIRTGEERGGKGWPFPYAARRIAWHVLDHAWEMEDKSEPA